MSLRVVIPFTQRHPLTVAAAPDGADWLDVTGDPRTYWRTMCAVWERAVERAEDILIIEHDVAVNRRAVERFHECDRPWCANPYDTICHWECMEAWANMLGCTRYRTELIAAVPDAVSAITDPAHLDWHNLCDGIAGNLRTAGFTHHWHFPPVVHHRGVQSPDVAHDIAVDWADIEARFG